MTTKTGREDMGDCYCYTHFMSDKDTPDKESEDIFKRHLLLEFLDYLSIIKYERGYDGYYYDIYIKKCNKNRHGSAKND